MIVAASAAADQAKDLLEFVGTPTALVTGTFLAFATKAIDENQARVDRGRMVFALLAALAATGVAGALLALMLPLGLRSLFVYRGGIEALLVVYWMLLCSASGTLAYSLWTLARCAAQLRRPTR
jgi:hypothetical protein